MRICLSFLFVFSYQIFAPLVAVAAPQWSPTHFGVCASDDVIMQADGGWWYIDNMGGGIAEKVKYGGSYITSRKTVLVENYRNRGSGLDKRYEVTGINLRTVNGSLAKRFYLPLSDADVICNYKG